MDIYFIYYIYIYIYRLKIQYRKQLIMDLVVKYCCGCIYEISVNYLIPL